jgi:cyclophilin family peptidyl-prolyl cis-trans isomerase
MNTDSAFWLPKIAGNVKKSWFRSRKGHHLPPMHLQLFGLKQRPMAMMKRFAFHALTTLACCFGFAVGPVSAATIVRFDTNFGAFDVELYDIPAMESTVANFLTYADAGLYDSTIIHRSTTYNPLGIQIIQGGGFVLQGSTISPVSTFAPIPLQALYSNLRGTIAMARTSDPNSATSGWFFNVANNTALDGGYAVFGSVVDAAGLSVIDAIAAVPSYDASVALGPVFTELPLTAPGLQVANLVMINSVTLVPEPSALVMVGFAALGIVTRRVRVSLAI